MNNCVLVSHLNAATAVNWVVFNDSRYHIFAPYGIGMISCARFDFKPLELLELLDLELDIVQLFLQLLSKSNLL